MSRDYRNELTDKVIEALEAGTAPWQKPWNEADGAALLDPMNPTTGARYRGMNAMNLMMAGYADPRWCTYKQAQTKGWQVRKGEKGTPIEYWQYEKEETRLDEASGKEIKVRAELERPRVFYATVFNCQQMENVPELQRPAPEWSAIEVGDAVIRNCGVPIFHDQRDRAFYMPSRDEIHAPPRASFPTVVGYYGTMFHEIGHSTGHESRLKREFGKSFGSPEYAMEELRAEMASLFMSARLGIPYNFENHAGYVGSWIKKLKEDKNELFRAARDAERIAEYVIDLGRQQEKTRDQKTPAVGVTETSVEERITGTRAIAQRQVNAFNKFVETTMEQFGLTREQSGNAWDYLVKHRLINIDSLGGQYTLQDGRYWDKEVMLRAANYSLEDVGSDKKDAQGAKVERMAPATEGKGRPLPPVGKKRHLPLEQRIKLFVAKKDNDRLAELGALFDGRGWYIGVDWDSTPFDQWLTPPKLITRAEVLREFMSACRAYGLNMENFSETEADLMTGTWQKTPVTTSSNHKKMSGAFILNEKGYGCIANHDQGNVVPFEPGGRIADEVHLATTQEQVRKNIEAKKAAEIKLRNTVAEKTAAQYDALVEDTRHASEHPYLMDKKHVPALLGVRRDKRDDRDLLVIPMRNKNGELRNVQFIDPDGNKKFRKDGEKKGCFFVVGKLEESDTILFGEGYATMATGYVCTGFPIVVCFDSGNIAAVMEALKDRTAHADKIIMSDNDLVTSKRVADTLNNAAVREKLGYPRVEAEVVDAALALNGKAVRIGGEDGRYGLIASERRREEHYGLPRVYAEIVEMSEPDRPLHKVAICNVGMEKALAAAEAHHAKAVAPSFLDSAAYEKGYKDFNDLQVYEGGDRVQLELAAVVDYVKGRRTVQMFAQEKGYNLIEFVDPEESGRYTGKIVGNVGAHAVQEVGRTEAAAHPIGLLDRVPTVDRPARIQYVGGQGKVDDPVSRDKGHGRE